MTTDHNDIICPSSFQGETYVMYGDENGSVSILVFHNPEESLFVTESKDVVSALEDIQMVLYSVRSFCQSGYVIIIMYALCSAFMA